MVNLTGSRATEETGTLSLTNICKGVSKLTEVGQYTLNTSGVIPWARIPG